MSVSANEIVASAYRSATSPRRPLAELRNVREDDRDRDEVDGGQEPGADELERRRARYSSCERMRAPMSRT